jgi:hypothetical protein
MSEKVLTLDQILAFCDANPELVTNLNSTEN